MPTAQVDAWAAVHRGSLPDISTVENASLADAAIARMMMHGRRAVVPQVVDEFFARAGSVFTPYLAGLAPQAAADFHEEIAAAKAAKLVAEGVCREAPPPLLFERAMLAEMEGKRADALADLRRLLHSYPGFVTAAFATARLALADDDPVGAIESLACVERELIQTREGAGLLADALRAIGMHETAGRYDLAALTNAGHLDSRGNDCAPVDVVGNFARHSRMLPAFYVETLPGGRILYNDRGVYYLTGSAIGGLLSAMYKTIRGPSATGLQVGDSAPDSNSGLKGNVLAKVQRFFRDGVTLRLLSAAAVQARRRAARLRAGADRALRRVLPRLAAWGLLQTPDRDRHSRLVQSRVRSGIASIFGLSTEALDPTFDRSDEARWTEPELPAGKSFCSASTEYTNLVSRRVSANLPPRAQEVLHRLASMAGVALT